MHLRHWLESLGGGLLVTIAALLVVPAAGAHHSELSEPHWAVPSLRAIAAKPVTSRPDLRLLLPRKSAEEGGIPAFFVDTHERPGRVLYRFDTVIFNSGGALDIYTPNDGRDVFQVVWPGGHPPAADLPSPFDAPGSVQHRKRRNGAGAEMKFVRKTGHNHFHVQRAARYELVLAGGAVRDSAKVGFCLLDSWDGPGTDSYFRISGEQNYCQHGNPGATFTRMGISPRVGDYYNAQLADQWVNVTGVRPGRHTLRGTVNADGVFLESSRENNTLADVRVIPGAIAVPASRSVAADRRTTITLEGNLVGASIRSRANASCDLYSAECYERAVPKRLDFQLRRKPRHGEVAIVSEDGLSARVRYTPEPGFRGGDSFRFTVTDSRGLRSAPATVRLTVG